MSLLLAFLCSFTISLIIVKSTKIHSKFTADIDFNSSQRMHTNSIPRIGGIALFITISLGLLYINNSSNIILSLFIVFSVGLLEDITKNISPTIRLLIVLIAATIAVYSIDIKLTSIAWQVFDDNILNHSIISISLTIFMLAGVTHSTNIIDGFNGILLGYSLISLLVFLSIATMINDQLIINITLISIGALLGLFIFNFPQAKIFTGDGGAYVIGFLLATISLLLVKRNIEVSPWTPLLVMIYPVFETLFSIYRRVFIKKLTPSIADALHLHTLVYKRIIRNFKTLINIFGKNSATSLIILLFNIPFIMPAFIWWDNHLAIITTIILFCICYVYIYFAIIKFKLNYK